MKKFFNVPLTWSMFGSIEVEADTPEEAYEKSLGIETPLPTESYYVDDSVQPSYPIEEYKEYGREETAYSYELEEDISVFGQNI